MKNLMKVAFAAMLLFAQFSFAGVACDLGVYSAYVNSVGTMLDNTGAVQGECTKAFSNGAYVNGWFSQSMSHPGWDKTFGNEIDLTAGWAGKVTEKLSVDGHVAYFDLANAKLLHGTNGDLTNVGGTITYKVSDTTSTYTNLETYYGLGQNGFADWWKVGLGVQFVVSGAAANAALYHNQTTGQAGEYAQFGIEPVRPLTKVLGGELRPNLGAWLPIGRYNNAHDPQIVVGLRINWR